MNHTIPRSAFKKGAIPWNAGVKGYRNHKNSANRLSKSKCTLFADSLRPGIRECGVYAIINRETLKIYIGSSVMLGSRLNRYRADYMNLQEQSRPVNKAISENPDGFEFSVIELCKNKKEALERERFWIKFYRSYSSEFGYNACPDPESCKGLQYSESRREEMRRRQNGKTPHWLHVPEVREKIRLALLGRTPTKVSVEKGIASRIARKIGWIPVIQMDMNGSLIATYERVKDAAAAVGFPKSKSNITAACRGKRDSALGFKWKYA